MNDLRWFAPNRYCTLPVPRLRDAGLQIALEGREPARLVVAADGQCAVEAFEFAHLHRAPLLLYLWDLPPWRLGNGRPDHVLSVAGKLWRLPRLQGRYPERPGYYSRIGFVARRAAAVWCPSANTVHDVGVRLGVTAEEVPFCYDSDRFRTGGIQRANVIDPRAPVRLLAVSRLVPHKNLGMVLEGAARLSRPAAVQIVGQGPEAESLRARAQALGVALELSGAWASDEEVLAAYRRADIVICPSRFEGFGLTPMEAVALGRPVVASDIPPHREFLEGAVRFFAPDAAEELAREIDAAALGAIAAIHPAVLQPLTIEACAARWLPRLTSLLQSARVQ